MAAAYMAWYAYNRPQQVSLLGDPIEGVLLLPYWKELDMEHAVDAQQMTIFS
jgi:predicted RNase H-like nuclease